jgi:hypothetical protein
VYSDVLKTSIKAKDTKTFTIEACPVPTPTVEPTPTPEPTPSVEPTPTPEIIVNTVQKVSQGSKSNGFMNACQYVKVYSDLKCTDSKELQREFMLNKIFRESILKQWREVVFKK